MKQVKFILALIAIFVSASTFAQIRGVYGSIQPYTIMSGTLYNNSLVAVSKDTLKGVDTAYIYFAYSTPLRLQFSAQAVPVSDTFSGNAVLQTWAGSNSGWVTRTGRWESVTGQTALCTTCVGASKTWSALATTGVSTWDVGNSQPSTFANWRIRIIGTVAADTAAVSGWSQYSY